MKDPTPCVPEDERLGEPARTHLAILGGGPVGLEAALAARDLGIEFVLFEAGPRVGHAVREWGRVRMFSPWSMNVSPRARQALGGAVPTSDTEAPTGDALVSRVLEPLSRLPGLGSRIRTGHRVLRVSRDGLLKSDEIGTGNRDSVPFRILVEAADGTESVVRADAVLDCTGTWATPNPTGRGGIPAPGEREARGVVRRVPDVAASLERWVGRRTLLVGSGHSAWTFARDLAAVAESHPGTALVWAFRENPSSFEPIPDDPLPLRARLARDARVLAEGGAPEVEPRPRREVEAIRTPREGGGFVVTLIDAEGRLEDVEVDELVSLTGFVGDDTLYRPLQVHECYATSGPMNLAAALLSAGGDGDCLAVDTPGPESLRNPEPHFFILGSKSYGRNSTFLLRTGWDQVDQVFGLLSRRPLAMASRD